MSDSIKLGSVALECPDARTLAAFYAEITGGTVTSADEDWATARCPGGDIDFQTAPGYRPPAWPDPYSSMQMHLDFLVDDADAAEARCWRPVRRSSTSSPVTTSACTPTRPATRSACASRAR
jgi:catechol-2,3-dioxygenase